LKKELAGFSTEIDFVEDNEFPELGKIFVIDSKLKDLYPQKISTIVGNKPIYNLEVSEANKNLKNMQKILDFFLINEITREDTVVAVGGGIVTDMTALAASLYLRGCKLALVPTTLLAMVDAAVGGKTAINFRGYKNNLGSFYPANRIIFNLDFLRNLPATEFENGFIEIKKMALLKNNGLLEMITSEAPLADIIQKAIDTKLEFCRKDLTDRGVRRFLNLGHTFAHVIETASDFKIPHGLAVAKGILLATEYSRALGKISETELENISQLFMEYKLPDFPNLELAKFQNIIIKDKKKGDNVNLVLLKGIYKPFLFTDTNLQNLYNFIYKK
jgi:3-dehydroquinate synthase